MDDGVKIDFYGNKTDASGQYIGTDFERSQAFKDAKAASDEYNAAASEFSMADESGDREAKRAAAKRVTNAILKVRNLANGAIESLPLTANPDTIIHTALFTIGTPGGGGLPTTPPFVPGSTVPFPPGSPPGFITPAISAQALNTIITTINSIGSIVSVIEKHVGEFLGDTISQINDYTQRVGNGIVDKIGTVLDAITGLGNGLFGGIGDLLGKIGEFIKKNLVSVVGDIIKFFSEHLGELVKNLAGLIEKVASVVEKIAKEIQDINDKIIQPITTTILDTIQTIGTLTAVIERDLHNGLQGILSIPTDIANALTSLDASISRSVEQMKKNNKEVFRTIFGGTDDDTIHTRLAAIFTGFSSGHSSAASATTFTDRVHLQEPTLENLSGEVIHEVIRKGKELLNIFVSSWSTAVKDLRGTMTDVPALFGYALEVVVWLMLFAATLEEDLVPILKALRYEANRNIPTEKLSPGDALRAWVRGFIDTDNLIEECKSAGYDDTRIQALKDLQRYLRDVESALDMFYRGIISESDLRENMVEHGMLPEQQDAAIAAGWRKVAVDTAIKAWRYGILNDTEVKAVMAASRFTDVERDLTLETALQREGVDDLILRHKYETLFSSHLTLDQFFNTLPGDIAEAAKRDGLAPQVAYDRWLRQLFVPPLQHWIELYFRGIRTHTELMAAMDFYRVPKEWRDDYIRAHQPLLPFRTIPTMLANGVISEAYAKEQLASRGFSLANVEALLKYGEAKKKTIKVQASGDLHALSVGNAKHFWELGAITDAQYLDILKAHGYDDHTAELTLHVEQLQQTAHERKQIATDIVNEVLSGLISVDDAQGQMSHYEFSDAERAKVLRSIARVQRTVAKTPGEAELRAMVKAKVISIDDYTQALGVLGFAKKWIDAFVEWHFGGTHGSTLSSEIV